MRQTARTRRVPSWYDRRQHPWEGAPMSVIRRREFITMLGGVAAWPRVARAQQTRTVPVVGVLWHAGSAEEEGPYFTALLQGFRDLGYIDGRTIKLEHRFPNEMPERFRGMAAELVSLNVDVLVSVGNVASPYAKDATTTIPVVFTLVADPVGMKLVESFARLECHGNIDLFI